MSDCDDLLEKARQNKKGLRFDEVLSLADCWGFAQRRSGGGTSHHVYKRPGFRDLLNFQPDQNGKAKPYQVGQLLRAINTLKEQKGEPK